MKACILILKLNVVEFKEEKKARKDKEKKMRMNLRNWEKVQAEMRIEMRWLFCAFIS